MIKFRITVLLLACSVFVSAGQTPETIIINPQATLKVKDSLLRSKIIIWSTAQLNDADYKHTKAQPSSNYFPGKVGAGAILISKTIHLKHQQISNQLLPIAGKLDY